MNKYAKWSERARQSYETAKTFSDIAPHEELIDQAFFGAVTKKVGSIGIYLEFYRSKLENNLSVRILKYFTAYDDVSGNVTAEKFTFNLSDNKTDTIEMIIARLDRGGIHTICVALELEYGTAKQTTKLVGIRAQLKKDYQKAKEYRCFDVKIPLTSWPDRSSNIRVSGNFFGKFVRDSHALCPNCFGIGSFLNMKIPKADWESGATGYHLYSCNQLNGRESCDVCGGTGGKYLEWYINENPHLKNVKFIPGNGMQKESLGQF